MPNAAKLIFNEVDQSFFVDSILSGVAAVQLQTKRGPYGHDGEIITSWPEFKKKYGGEVLGKLGVTLARRALNRGAKLRVNKIGHYTDPATPSTLDAVKATVDETPTTFAVNATLEEFFDLLIKYPGEDYNNITIQILPASNGVALAFNLAFTHNTDSEVNELYQNIQILGQPTAADSNYLQEVVAKSKLFDVVYKDTSAFIGNMRPLDGSWGMENGTDGSAVVNADYIGDPVGTGFYAFDRFDDFEVMGTLDNFAGAIITAGASYAENREDLVYLGHLDNTNATVATLQSARAALTVDTRYCALFAGGLSIPSPFAEGSFLEISELGDVIGAAARSSAEFGPWWSFAGTNRGFVTNAVAVINNFVESAKQDQLAQRQINIVVNVGGQIYIKGNFSAQLNSSRKSFLNVVKLIIFLRKSLKPVLERYLEQPADFRTFREIYTEVEPFLSSLVGNEARALVEYKWKGDQFANRDSDLKVNTRALLDQGKYKAELYLKEVVSLQEFTINIISSPSGVTFEDNF